MTVMIKRLALRKKWCAEKTFNMVPKHMQWAEITKRIIQKFICKYCVVHKVNKFEIINYWKACTLWVKYLI